jgi:hypothetical protein
VLDQLRSPLQHFLYCVSVHVFLCLSSPVYSTSEGRLQHGDVVHDTLAEVHTNSVDRPHSCTASLADTLLSSSRAETIEMPEIDMELQWTRNARSNCSKFGTNAAPTSCNEVQAGLTTGSHCQLHCGCNICMYFCRGQANFACRASSFWKATLPFFVVIVPFTTGLQYDLQTSCSPCCTADVR